MDCDTSQIFVQPQCLMGYQTILMPMIIPQPIIPVLPVMVQDISNYCTCDITKESCVKTSNESQSYKSEYFQLNNGEKEYVVRTPLRKHKKPSVLAQRIKGKKPIILRQIENYTDPNAIVITKATKSGFLQLSTRRRSQYIGVVKNAPKFHAFIVVDSLKVSYLKSKL